MKEFRRKHPWLFWTGTVVAVVAAGYADRGFGAVMHFAMTYDPKMAAEYDLLMSPAQYATITWLLWVAWIVPLVGLVAAFISLGYARLSRIPYSVLAFLILMVIAGYCPGGLLLAGRIFVGIMTTIFPGMRT